MQRGGAFSIRCHQNNLWLRLTGSSRQLKLLDTVISDAFFPVPPTDSWGVFELEAMFDSIAILADDQVIDEVQGGLVLPN